MACSPDAAWLGFCPYQQCIELPLKTILAPVHKQRRSNHFRFAVRSRVRVAVAFAAFSGTPPAGAWEAPYFRLRAPSHLILEECDKNVTQDGEERTPGPRAETKPSAPAFNEAGRNRAGKVLCRRTCRDAPSGPGTARSNSADACGGLRTTFRRRRFDPAPGTPGGAHAPIECRSRRTLRGEEPWGKRNRNVEPY
jgi:hypothetical protein